MTRVLLRLKPHGKWHRRSAADPNTTACGLGLGGPYATREQRPEDNDLCPICFSRHEIDTGKMERLKKELAEHADPELYFDIEFDPTPVHPIDPELAAALLDGEVEIDVDVDDDPTPVDRTIPDNPDKDGT